MGKNIDRNQGRREASWKSSSGERDPKLHALKPVVFVRDVRGIKTAPALVPVVVLRDVSDVMKVSALRNRLCRGTGTAKILRKHREGAQASDRGSVHHQNAVRRFCKATGTEPAASPATRAASLLAQPAARRQTTEGDTRRETRSQDTTGGLHSQTSKQNLLRKLQPTARPLNRRKLSKN